MAEGHHALAERSDLEQRLAEAERARDDALRRWGEALDDRDRVLRELRQAQQRLDEVQAEQTRSAAYRVRIGELQAELAREQERSRAMHRRAQEAERHNARVAARVVRAFGDEGAAP